jgi:hypothetical protein
MVKVLQVLTRSSAGAMLHRSIAIFVGKNQSQGGVNVVADILAPPRNKALNDLYLDLFNPLSELKKKPSGPAPARRKAGPHGKGALSGRINRRAG